jgi:hypothetical protein
VFYFSNNFLGKEKVAKNASNTFGTSVHVYKLENHRMNFNKIW